ncbi:zinc-binding dehydrogenase [Actinophytocola algeriensis]|uniref:Alcohol dehydrogenase n=1 Tax=Actinophytocola algeriensis TaxID=1768010 RepID=A0A7W7QB14_9PSEU|nr:zinc-binding dehydrogenase [Actinophytocola algeriensis]MBB4909964.1 alcohol dehydrogenase [Actinophytocola algeriensis]MBE1475954.1 alcohol dehydrogenase [Actinophytocola algeriensis]
MLIKGAVLRTAGASRPYRSTRPLSIEDVTLAPPGEDEVLVEIEAAGVCHSDLSVIDGNRPRPVPMLLGHEAAGRVVTPGAGFDVGDRVVLSYLPRCGSCAGCASAGRFPCAPGSQANAAGTLFGGERRLSVAGAPVHHHLGVSAFATHAVVDRRSLVRVPDSVPAEVAALLGCAVLTGGGALLNAASLRAGESVAVVGLGGVGLAAVLTAAALGAGEIVAIDPVAAKRATAAALGATRTMSPEQAAGLAVDVAVEAAGAGAAVSTALAVTGPGGRTVIAGLTHPDVRVPVSPLDLVANGRSVIGSYMGSSVPARDVPRFVELWQAGRLPVERLISARIGLADLNEAMDDLADATALRQVVLPG